MNEIKPCDEVCSECGFLNDSVPGVLQEELGLAEIVRDGVIFPCHLQLKAVTGSENTGVEEYAAHKDKFKVCRGYVESMYISGMHKNNPIWKNLFAMLDGKINTKTMNILQTIQYHKKKRRVE